MARVGRDGDGVGVFFQHLNTLDIRCQTTVVRLKRRGEEKAACLGTSGLEVQPEGESPGFPFPLHISDQILEKLSTQNHQWVQTEKAPNRSLPKDRERGNLARQTFRQPVPYFRQTPWGKGGATLIRQGQVGSLDQNLYLAM